MKKYPPFKKSILDNGMVLVTESLPRFESLSIGIWVNAGTRHEVKGQEGLSHFLEHMMFKGTDKRSALDIALAVDRVGGDFNAFTSREYTCFHLLLLARDLKMAAEIMSDILLNSRFAEEEIERERKVILQEISMAEDNPEELIHDLFFEQAFGGHALGKPILGRPETVSRFDRDIVYSYFKRHYSPSQIIISVAGDVSHEKVKTAFNRYLCGRRGFEKRNTRTAFRRKPNSQRPRLKPGARVFKRSLEQSHVVAGFPSIPYDHPDRFAAFLVNIYLGGGMSSSLFQEIREKRGLAYTVYSALEPFSDTGLMSIYAGTSPSEVGVCLDVIGRELAKLKRSFLDREAVEILKDNLKGTILLNSDSVESRMMAIAKNEMFFGRYYPMKKLTRDIERVTFEDIRRVARKAFQGDKLILSVMGPRLHSGLQQKLLKHL